ncbi:UNVERIFIED_ORG: excinuclease ABC subunit A [Gordonia westfalica J30]
MRGAREHNLRDIDVDIPRVGLVVVTGVSGSGKSSLVFDTLFAEGQRRLLHTISPYARRVIDQLARPRVRSITGLPPVVAVSQRHNVSGRATVGTTTTVSDGLRLLVSRLGDYPPGIEPMEAEAFSAATHAGACAGCEGTGRRYDVSERSLVPDPTRSIREGAISAWPGAWHGKNLRDILDALGIDIDTPFSELDEETRRWILFTDEQPVVTVHPERDATTVQGSYQGTYMSARRYVLHTFATTKSAALRGKAERHLEITRCPGCGGTGLSASARAVTFAGHTIIDLEAMPLADLDQVLAAGTSTDDVARNTVDREIIGDIRASVTPLLDLGLGYIAPRRGVRTLSAGEFGRVRLARQVTDGLSGLLYIFDEPSAALHPDDLPNLLSLFDRLRAMGGSVVAVDHNPTIMRAADWLVDLGPKAGVDGGHLVYSGPPEGVIDVAESLTGAALRTAVQSKDAGKTDRQPRGHLCLTATDGVASRLPPTRIPLGVVTAITGRSGTGKTRFLVDALIPAASNSTRNSVHRVIELDQRPIGRTPRSVVATYVGIFDEIRRVYAATDTARAHGFGVGAFSFNVAQGRCPGCGGEGSRELDLHFLPSVRVECDECDGARYRPEVLEVTVDGRTVADVLALSVGDAVEVFADNATLRRGLDALLTVGLGYLTLGHSAMELSGGEAQRVRLANELQKQPSRGPTMYVLDTPSTGLHPCDIDRIRMALQGLVARGDTVVIAEHDPQLIAIAEHRLDIVSAPGASVVEFAD